MSRRVLRALSVSLLLHGVLVAAVLMALPRSEVLPALFVDLTGPDELEAAREPGGDPPGSSVREAALNKGASAPTPRQPAPHASDAAGSAAPSPRSMPSSEPAPSPEVAIAPTEPPPHVPPPPAVAPPAAGPPRPGEPPTEVEAPSASAAPSSTDGGASTADSGAVPSPPPTFPSRGDEVGASGDTRPSIASGETWGSSRSAAPRGGTSGTELARRSPGGEGGGPPAAFAEYLRQLRQRIHEALRYPAAARRRGLAGAVTIELTILPSGAIRDVAVVESSTHPILDEAAVDTVRGLRAQPFPAEAPARMLRVRLPVVFHLQ